MSHDGRTTSDGSSKLNRFKRRDVLAAAGASAAVPLAGCGGNGNGNGDGPITIGAVYLLSGLAEALGAGSVAAAEVAADVLNEEGGVDGREVEVVSRDHGDAPSQQIRSLVQEVGADALLGLTSSTVGLDNGPTFEQLGVPTIITDLGTPWLTEHDRETYGNYYDGDTPGAAGVDNLFRANSHTGHMTYGLAAFTDENYDEGLDIAAMGPDYSYGQQTWRYFQAFLDGLGYDYNVVAEEFPELGAGDMTPQITNVQQADPDIVFTSFWAGDTVTFTRQANEAGLFDDVIDVYDTIGADSTNFNAIGDAMPEGFHYSGWYYPGAYGTDEDQEFIDAYFDFYEDDDSVLEYPTFTGGSTYTAVMSLASAIEETGSTAPSDLVEFLRGHSESRDPRGPSAYDDTSQQMQTTAVIGESTFDGDVPYDGATQTNFELYELDRETAVDLLEGTGLPPGV